jgi:hypothetical protein
MPYRDSVKGRVLHAKYMREVWYPKNKKKHIGYVTNLKTKVKKYLEEYKRSKVCTDCGISGNKFPEILDFDHIGEKKFQIGSWRKSVLSVEKIQIEMKKCEIVCANCHRIRTVKRRRAHV